MNENTFAGLGLSERICSRIEREGITTPTRVQIDMIPAIVAGRDALAQSETGSGKTLSFALPILDAVKHGEGTQALIIAPTRELALQITAELDRFKPDKRIRTLTVYGGVGYEKQIEGAKKSEIIVGTPGRIHDLVQQGAFDFSRVCFLVLDEADRMLDMGFAYDLNGILKTVPEKRQTLFFSATITERIEELMHEHLHDPAVLKLENKIDPYLLRQEFYEVEQREKFALLVHLLKERRSERALIFANTKRFSNSIVMSLAKSNVKAQALHGDMTQAQREKTIKGFQTGRFPVLVATDVASRGLHVDEITHVYNYDVPDTLETYIHRIGRTARQGSSGIATTILAPSDHDAFHAIFEEFENVLERKDKPPLRRVPFVIESRDRRQRPQGFKRMRRH